MSSLSKITKELLASYNLFPKKRLGQHFLVDPMVLERIIEAAELNKDDVVLEIGTGLGILTAELAKRAKKVVSVDVDQDMIDISRQVLKDFDNVELIRADVLKYLDRRGVLQYAPKKIIGNLPYYITAPIIEKIFCLPKGDDDHPRLLRAVLMLQKEVAQRMAANPGSKQYGSFSVFVQFHAEVELLSLVSKSSFIPWPEVSSAIVVLSPHKTPRYKVKDEKLFFDIVHKAFQQRRKKLRNSLKDFKLENAGVDLNKRPEQLSIEDFAALANSGPA
ncbi:MAG: 16S rRNA (adenine(1518)-N(6)/adenine(1519)-N(6))-dimethyltransferase RsmA [Candidatus Margulisiibacteriota bacterium]